MVRIETELVLPTGNWKFLQYDNKEQTDIQLAAIDITPPYYAFCLHDQEAGGLLAHLEFPKDLLDIADKSLPFFESLGTKKRQRLEVITANFLSKSFDSEIIQQRINCIQLLFGLLRHHQLINHAAIQYSPQGYVLNFNRTATWKDLQTSTSVVILDRNGLKEVNPEEISQDLRKEKGKMSSSQITTFTHRHYYHLRSACVNQDQIPTSL